MIEGTGWDIVNATLFFDDLHIKNTSERILFFIANLFIRDTGFGH